MRETVQQLLDLAEDRIRLRGFHAVSFRDLADELGIKSSSVHYHFPQKQDLGLALVERYSNRVFEALEKAAEKATLPSDFIDAMSSVYRHALKSSDRICLCGMLGAESAGLPEPVADAVSDFLRANVNWLTEKLDMSSPSPENRTKATQIVATLQGAMMMANSLKDAEVFEGAVQGLHRTA